MCAPSSPPMGATPVTHDELDLAQSAAGEEDPGASIEGTLASADPGKPASAKPLDKEAPAARAQPAKPL